jgi:demethylmenaquinone methyltransferase/2-methoxy-6-polyprenyl-1,4-benzoquinol methylase
MTAQLQGEAKSQYVQDMFGRIARRYDLMNRLMTGGQDMRWRRFVIKKARLAPDEKLLDLATGTGDIAFEALKATPNATVVGADFALPMMIVGQGRKLGDAVRWSGADALHLPFPDESFDVITQGYLLRNVVDIPQALSEQFRVLKSGGRVVVLDSSPPPKNLLRPFIMIHLRYIIPLLGRFIVGKEGADAYRYLPESTQAFKTPQELVKLMQEAGFVDVSYQSFMFGTMCVHWGMKP